MVCCESPSPVERADFGRFVDYNPANIERNISQLSTSSHGDLDNLSESEDGIVFTIDYAEDSRSSTERSEDSGVEIRQLRKRGMTECSEGTEERSEDSGVEIRHLRKRGMTECS